jgi:hypothetical protein
MIKIEVTGNSIPEVADKLLAIGASLRASTAVLPIANGGTGAQTLEEVMEVAEAAPVDPTPAPKSAPVAEVSESQPTTTEPSSTPAPAASTSEADTSISTASETTDQPSSQPSEKLPPASASELSFETDVTPVVLAVVQAKGKPVVEEILSQFGVARASQLDPARWPELLAALKDQL